MSPVILKLPVELELNEGEHFSLKVEGVMCHGELVATRVICHETTLSDTSNAIESFLSFCEEHNPGQLTGATSEELEALQNYRFT